MIEDTFYALLNHSHYIKFADGECYDSIGDVMQATHYTDIEDAQADAKWYGDENGEYPEIKKYKLVITEEEI